MKEKKESLTEWQKQNEITQLKRITTTKSFSWRLHNKLRWRVSIFENIVPTDFRLLLLLLLLFSKATLYGRYLYCESCVPSIMELYCYKSVNTHSAFVTLLSFFSLLFPPVALQFHSFIQSFYSKCNHAF